MQTTAGPLRGAPTARGHRLFPICIRNNTPRPRKSKSVTSCIRSTFFFFFFFLIGYRGPISWKNSNVPRIDRFYPIFFFLSLRPFLCKHHVIVISRQLNFFFFVFLIFARFSIEQKRFKRICAEIKRYLYLYHCVGTNIK